MTLQAPHLVSLVSVDQGNASLATRWHNSVLAVGVVNLYLGYIDTISAGPDAICVCVVSHDSASYCTHAYTGPHRRRAAPSDDKNLVKLTGPSEMTSN